MVYKMSDAQIFGDKDTKNTEKGLFKNGIMRGYMFIKFFDENKRGQAYQMEPLSTFVIPLDYFHPFKPINLEIYLPLYDQRIQDDLDIDLKL